MRTDQFFVANLLEMQRRMKGILLPSPIGLARGLPNLHRKVAVKLPKNTRPLTRDSQSRSSMMSLSGRVRPAAYSCSALSFIATNRPAAASAFICLSQSSSSKGCSTDISSQYSCGESRSIASLISATVETPNSLAHPKHPVNPGGSRSPQRDKSQYSRPKQLERPRVSAAGRNPRESA